MERPDPSDTPEGISQFRARCELEGVDAPSVEDVRVEIARRRLR